MEKLTYADCLLLRDVLDFALESLSDRFIFKEDRIEQLRDKVSGIRRAIVLEESEKEDLELKMCM